MAFALGGGRMDPVQRAREEATAQRGGPESGTFVPEVATGPGAVAVATVAKLVACALFLVAVLRFGWVSDDAFITIRSVDHLLAGNGFSVHADMRVQAFTSPGWALLCVPFLALTGDPYPALVLPALFCVVGLSIVVSRGLRRTPERVPFVLLLLGASSSFLAYCTSGLENPLSHVLLAAFCLERLARGNRPTAAGYWLGAGLFLTRYDLVLLVLPSLLSCTALHLREGMRKLIAPLTAALLWPLFATFYYGFPLPNTAYAKLNVKLPPGASLGRGAEYLLDSAARDPIVLVTILCSCLLVLRRGVPWAVRALQGGVVLYVAYVVSIGGDFMSGRFLTACFLMSVLVAVERLGPVFVQMPRAALVLSLPVLFLFFEHFRGREPNQRSAECRVGTTGIVDERDCYVEHMGLAQNLSSPKWKEHGYIADFRKVLKKTKDTVVPFGVIGMVSYAKPKQVHIVETYALSEPLLARIRVEPEGAWRAGHFPRPLPEGYLESLRTGENLLQDPCLRDLHAHLTQATTRPLWSWERLRALARLNSSSFTCPS